MPHVDMHFMRHEAPEEMLYVINEIRAEKNLNPVVMRDDLNCGAKVWAKQMWRLGYCGHTNPVDNSAFWDRVRMCDGEIRGGTEIIACNVQDFRYAIGQWIMDEANYRVITYPTLQTIGIGHAGWDQDGNQGWYVLLAETPANNCELP